MVAEHCFIISSCCTMAMLFCCHLFSITDIIWLSSSPNIYLETWTCICIWYSFGFAYTMCTTNWNLDSSWYSVLLRHMEMDVKQHVGQYLCWMSSKYFHQKDISENSSDLLGQGFPHVLRKELLSELKIWSLPGCDVARHLFAVIFLFWFLVQISAARSDICHLS